MKQKKISEAVGNISQKYVEEAALFEKSEKALLKKSYIKWGAVAACFALVLLFAVGALQSGLFGGKTQVAVLENGSEIRFKKANYTAEQADIDFGCETEIRDLTESEIETLFGQLAVTAHAVFRAQDGSIIGLDGEMNGIRLNISIPGISLRDTVVDGEESVSYVDGVAVNAGYFITDANSKGEKNMIYYASFALGGNTVYMEHGGLLDNRENIKNEFASAMQSLLSLKEINLSQIKL